VVLIGGAEDRDAIHSEWSMCLRKGGDGILRGGDEGGSGDHVGQERVCSDYVEGVGSCSSTTRFGEVKMDQPFLRAR
jgi:hypothetical protein